MYWQGSGGCEDGSARANQGWDGVAGQPRSALFRLPVVLSPRTLGGVLCVDYEFSSVTHLCDENVVWCGGVLPF